jgi:hypothetical protein
MLLLAQARLTRARSVAELVDDRGVRYLEIRSRIDAAQHLVLPLPPPGGLAGLALSTRSGRFTDLPWGLVYGSGSVPDDARVRFSTAGLRWRRTVDVLPQRLAHDCWVADAEGAFASSAVVQDEEVLAETLLRSHW